MGRLCLMGYWRRSVLGGLSSLERGSWTLRRVEGMMSYQETISYHMYNLFSRSFITYRLVM